MCPVCPIRPIVRAEPNRLRIAPRVAACSSDKLPYLGVGHDMLCYAAGDTRLAHRFLRKPAIP